MTNSTSAVRLGDYINLQRGNTYKSALLGQPGPVLLGLASIERNGGFRSDNLKTYGGASDPRMLLQSGDIYVSLKDVTQSADLLGAVSRVPESIGQGRLTQDTVKLVFKVPDAPTNYLYWVLRTPQYREYCRAHATGTTNLGLPRDDFLSFLVPPPNAARTNLASLLQALDNKIDLNRRMNETLEAMARAIFKDWFVDFGPTRAKMEGREPCLAADIWSLFPDRLDDDDMPEGWSEGTLADCAALNPESWTRSDYPARIQYVDLANTKWGTIEAAEPIERDKAPSRAQRILREGDTIVGTVRPGNGSFALVGRMGLTGSTGFAVLRPKSVDCREAIYLAATAPENIERLSHLADGAAYPAVRPDVVLATELALPGPEIVAAFHNIAAPLYDRIAANHVEVATLAETRDYLLPKLMSGEIRVREAERLAEAAE